MKSIKTVSWLISAMLSCALPIGVNAQQPQSLAERFLNPPAKARILKIVHGLPDAQDTRETLIQSLRNDGFGGIVTNVSFTDYLQSEEKWSAFIQGVHTAKDAGMAIWLYDERGYPSCKAGGLTLKDHPEWQAQGLLIADAKSAGGKVELAIPPGDLIIASAFPVTNGVIDLKQASDLSSSIRDGRLSWQAPEGSWQVMIIAKSYLHEGTHADGNLSDTFKYPNLLQPEPTKRFIELTHDAYAQRLGNDLKPFFISTFTDEPSLMSLFLKRQDWRVLPWAPNLPVEFQKRRGYAIEPLLPALVADAGAEGSRARHDFWLTVGELVSENYFGQLQAWCREHNLLSGGHLLMEESMLAHVALYGDFFRCIRRLDAPSMDCLTSIPAEVPWYVARLISSAAEIDNRSVTMSETSDHSQHYRPKGDTRPVRVVTEDEIRGTCNRLVLNGMTTITSYYTFAELSTAQKVRLNEWIGRCCEMLSGGHQVADIAMLYPTDSIWPRFVPSHHQTEDCPPDTQRIQTVFRAASNGLYAARRDFTYVDAITLCETKVDQGVLTHGNLQWRVIVLPCADTLPLQAWENLAAFWRSGGAVVALSRLPANSEREFPCSRVQDLAKEMFGLREGAHVTTNPSGGAGVFLSPGSEGLLPFVLDSIIAHDVELTERGAPIRVTHRRIDSHEIFFVINDSDKPWSGSLRFAAQGESEQWDPATGKMQPLQNTNDITATLAPYGGMFYRFTSAQLPPRKTLPEGVLPGLAISPLRAAPPTVGKGEFVDGDVQPTADGRWESNARVTKSDVDTFLFATFAFDTPIDLRDTVCMVMDTVVPDGQGVTTPLRIIVQDKNGVEYLANSDRPLNAVGAMQNYVFLDQFERAGWSKTAPAELDWSSVTAIRIGWGGYIGKEGDLISWTVAPIRIGRIAADPK